MANCSDKIRYKTIDEAQAVVHSLRKDYRRKGGGHGLRRLHAYWCTHHGCWHVGHDKPKFEKQKPATKRIPTTGQLWRRLRKIEERIDKEKWQRAFTLGQLIERDRQRYEAEGLL